MRRTAALLIIAIAISMGFLDRPLATYVQRTFASPGLSRWADGFFLVLLVFGAALATLFLGLGSIAFRRRPLRPWMVTLLASSAAGLAALIMSEALKFIIGRTPAYPTFLVDGVAGFAPFHWGSFPSSTAAATTAVGGVLWVAWPRGRPVQAIVLLVVSATILAVNAHWLSDVLAGVLLGGITARLAGDREVLSLFTHSPRSR